MIASVPLWPEGLVLINGGWLLAIILAATINIPDSDFWSVVHLLFILAVGVSGSIVAVSL
jgi:hypothetical protein